MAHKGNRAASRVPGPKTETTEPARHGIPLRGKSCSPTDSHLWDWNPGPQLYESCALPTELRWQCRSLNRRSRSGTTVRILLNPAMAVWLAAAYPVSLAGLGTALVTVSSGKLTVNVEAPTTREFDQRLPQLNGLTRFREGEPPCEPSANAGSSEPRPAKCTFLDSQDHARSFTIGPSAFSLGGGRRPSRRVFPGQPAFQQDQNGCLLGLAVQTLHFHCRTLA